MCTLDIEDIEKWCPEAIVCNLFELDLSGFVDEQQHFISKKGKRMLNLIIEAGEKFDFY